MWMLVWAAITVSATLPARAVEYLPMVQQILQASWPTLDDRAVIPAQIEQETCPSLTSKSCWNPRAELKTQREYGFGLGQLTVTPRFNTFEMVKGLNQTLRDWSWEHRFDPAMQIRALIALDRSQYGRFTDQDERLAFMLSAYNGGLGGVLQDRRLCAAQPDCDPHRWFGHVERYSWRAKTKVQGYGHSFFDINRTYVRNILQVRKAKYETHQDA